MLYGSGWIAFTGTSTLRFLVMTAALIVTLVLGYVRFVRKGKMPPTMGGEQIKKGDNLGDIERRIRDLETRMNDAAKALEKTDES
jgi:Na+/proline symporter